ncbi:[Pyruvate dehydrogenase (acetyl-transferring)] kinase isozyme 2 [Coemansia erecta]|uniref:Protein-serine/threonine kinase n=1 Tax=Coemansia erecta TaxID=147472 RepID=A0A9W8CPF9_9FUNG|nr:[Pyruvate dehydrogenase (acetyl-transferring)] kinase isozyme 2 [Coemansia erecta]
MNSKVPKDMFRRFASKEMTKLTLSQYYTAGRHLLKHRNSGGDAGFSAFQLTAKFLYSELPVRIGQAVTGLKQNPSPYNIRQVQQFKALMDNYADDFSLLVDGTPAPNTPAANEKFVETLRRLKSKYRINMWMLSQGLRELSSAINEHNPQIVPGFLLPDATATGRRQEGVVPQHYYSSTLAYPDLSAPMAYLAPSGKMEMTDPSQWSQLSGPLGGEGTCGSSGGVSAPHQWRPNRVCSEFCDEASCRNPRLWFSDGTQRCAENQTRRFFDWLYSMNLGTQLLIEDHVAIHDYGHNLVQIIQPLEIANRAAHDASVICQRHYGFPAPVIKVIAPTPGVTTTYVPHYLYSMLFQLLKNALRATIEHHAKMGEGMQQQQRRRMPMIKLVMSSGDEDVTFKVSDEGGGIPLSQMDAIWSYLKTTKDPASVASSAKNGALSSITFMKRASDMPLFGVGDGLPMTRQIARYFGGDLDLVSMEGVGTDAYLHLSRSRNAVEHTSDLSTLLDSSSASESLMGFAHADIDTAAMPASASSSSSVSV